MRGEVRLKGTGTMTRNGRIALVTGAGSGIGRATAVALLKEGYSVVLAGRRPEALEQTAAEAAFRLMREQTPRGGRIINNGSISAHVPRPNSVAYTATKHAITGLTKSTALDGRKYDIACGQIDIGNAGTEMTARMKEGVIQASGATAVEP